MLFFLLCIPFAWNVVSCQLQTRVSSTIQDKPQVVGITTSGGEGNYRFSVTLQTPDTGCEQYADWWEVITPEGILLYRRILAHSHVNEQPFTRSGGGVAIIATDTVLVRVHMNTTGYGSHAMKGNIAEGFQQVILPEGFAQELALVPPLPNGCAF